MVIRPIIIGIAGKKQSGKNTAASMINYMLSKGIANADYYDWANKEDVYKKGTRIIHFADKLKDYCSEIFNISRACFDNNNIKENYVWSITHQKLINRIDVDWNKYYEITIFDLKDTGLNLMTTRTNTNKFLGKSNVISLKTIMQYIGTEIFRNLISTNIWIDMTINKAVNCATNGYCLIPDVRFFNECLAIRDCRYKGIVIKIIGRENNNDNHESEKIDFDGDYNVKNDSTKMTLFYKLMQILKLELA